MDKKKLNKLNASSEALAKLLNPFAEVVVHDVKKDTILSIFNSFSKRRVGDASHIDLSEIQTQDDYFGPYTKTNWDGRPLKCLTFIERDEKCRPILMQCINIDVSSFVDTQKLFSSFLGVTPVTPRHQNIFKENIYEHMNSFVTQWTSSRNISLSALTKQEKEQIIKDLQIEGAFEKKNAAEYIGRVLGISRASVYNYLKEAV
jgi:predicted transcriptional regulator YheO